jgi:BASS family bile acid:Na+ symporter
MADVLQTLIGITVAIFMVGSLLGMGLRLDARRAWSAMRDVRFMALAALWSFVLGPALAVLLTHIVPLAEPYALGLIFLGMAPCAPFLPMISERAGGDLAYVAAFMLLTAVGTVIYMPLAVPLLTKGFSADPWTIAKPLLLFMVIPLAAGAAIRQFSEASAEKLNPVVTTVTSIDIAIMLLAALVVYWRDVVGSAGTYAIGVQVLYYALLGAGAYGLAFGLPHGQKSVLALGLCTRNIGAALAPLFAVAGTDRRAIVMCIVATFLCIVTGMCGALLLARRAPPGEPART